MDLLTSFLVTLVGIIALVGLILFGVAHPTFFLIIFCVCMFGALWALVYETLYG